MSQAEQVVDNGASEQYTVYLAGPMTNIPAFNFPAFFEVDDWLVAEKGWHVWNPARKDLEQIPLEEMKLIPGYDTGDLPTYVANSSFTMALAMEWDLPAILNSNGIVLMPGWEGSTGARYERLVAEALDRDVWLLRVADDYEAPRYELVRDESPAQLTQFLRGFADEAPTAAPFSLENVSALELVAELASRYEHVPGMTTTLDRISAQLA